MNGLAAFIAGAGTGYFSRKDKEAELERQQKMDQITLDRAAREKRDDEAAQSLKTDLGAASEDQTVTPQVKPMRNADGDIAGSTTSYQAGAAQFGTQQEAATAATSANSAEGRLARQVGVLNKHGKVNEAMDLQAKGKQSKLADLQLSEAELKHADNMTNRAIDDEIGKAGGNVFAGLAAIGTKSQIGGAAKQEIQAVPTKDGKGMQMVATGPDGKQTVIRTYSNDDAGAMAARQDFMKVDPATRINWLHERSKDAKAEEWKNKEFDLTKSNTEFNQKMATANLSLRQMEIGFAAQRAAREKATYDAEAKIPPAERAKIATLDKEIDVVNKAIVDAKAKGEWNPNSPSSAELIKQLERAQDRHSAALAPFMSAKTAALADPEGIRGKGVPAALSQPSQMTPQPAAAPTLNQAAPAAAQGVPLKAAPPQAITPLEAAGQKVDSAKLMREAALVKLQKFGLAQRRANPEAYQQAITEAEQAKALLLSAQSEYEPLANAEMRSNAPIPMAKP